MASQIVKRVLRSRAREIFSTVPNPNSARVFSLIHQPFSSSSSLITATFFPGDGIGPEIAESVKQASLVDFSYNETYNIHSEVGARGLSRDSLRKLPYHAILKDMKATHSICTICLQDIEVGDIARSLPQCHHMFHLVCVDKHFPSVNWLISYSKYSTALESFYEKFDSDFIDIRTNDLNEIVQLVGKDALAETDKITLDTAKLLREDYLTQNVFTPYDKFCPFYKSVWMMRNIIHFYNLANQAVERGAGMDGQKISYILIKHRLGDLFYRLVSQKFEDPAEGEDVLVAKFKKLHEDLTSGFRNLEDETR